MTVEVDMHRSDIPKELLDGLAVEGVGPRQHVVQQHSAGPHVTLVVVESLDHFGSHVQR